MNLHSGRHAERSEERAQSKRAGKGTDRDVFRFKLLCADGSYYVGSTFDLNRRLSEHDAGVFSNAYTRSRLPVEMVWSEVFTSHDEAFRCERQIKGWTRAKKEALIRGDYDAVHAIVVEERERRRGESS